MIEKLIETLKAELANGAEVETFTIVLKKDYTVYVVTCDDFKNVSVDRV